MLGNIISRYLGLGFRVKFLVSVAPSGSSNRFCLLGKNGRIFVGGNMIMTQETCFMGSLSFQYIQMVVVIVVVVIALLWVVIVAGGSGGIMVPVVLGLILDASIH